MYVLFVWSVVSYDEPGYRQDFDALLQQLKQIVTAPGTSATCHTFNVLPLTLLKEDHPSICFWTRKEFDEYITRNDGETDGLALKKTRRGRPSNDDDEKHPYLENEDGTPVDHYQLNLFGNKARRLFESMRAANVAPTSWAKMTSQVYEYFRIEMLSEFKEFRYCDGNWKLDLWATRTYGSWMQRIRKLEENDNVEGSSRPSKRRKVSKLESPSPSVMAPILDDSTLFKIDGGENTDAPIMSMTPRSPPLTVIAPCQNQPTTMTTSAPTATINIIDPLWVKLFFEFTTWLFCRDELELPMITLPPVQDASTQPPLSTELRQVTSAARQPVASLAAMETRAMDSEGENLMGTKSIAVEAFV
jgi:hypothetical protein